MDKIVYSVVAPVYNELDNLPELYRRLGAALDGLNEPWEIILIDDGSSDGSTEAILALAAKDRRVRPVIFSRNFGHQLAVTAGLDYSRGDAVIIIDSDLQDPPEVIPDLVEQWRAGAEVVFAVRSEREGESWFKEFTASLFYRSIRSIADVDIPMDTGDFRLLDRKVVNVLGKMRERHRFLRGMSVWVGFRQVGVPYRREARFAGETKYPFRKMLGFAMNAVTSFSFAPLPFATFVGFLCALLSAIAIVVVIALRLAGNQAFFGQASTLIAVLFLGGVQLISIGILGSYVGRLYDEAKGRPLYIVETAPEDVPVSNHKNES